MAQTAEQRKIQKLESTIKKLRAENRDLEKQMNAVRAHYVSVMHAERRWRQTFQALIKAAAQEDFLERFDNDGYYNSF
mgnify:CR=1 FL=1